MNYYNTTIDEQINDHSLYLGPFHVNMHGLSSEMVYSLHIKFVNVLYYFQFLQGRLVFIMHFCYCKFIKSHIIVNRICQLQTQSGNHPYEQNRIFHIMSMLRYTITVWRDIHSLPQSVFNLKSLHQHFNKTFRQPYFRWI